MCQRRVESRWLIAWWPARVMLAVALLFPLPAGAQEKAFSPEQLDQIVAPIALYPDPLLAQILMASTYPLEVVEAARFAKANPNLKDKPLDEALQKQTWDDSVKSLVGFPQVLTMMNDKLDWTQKLGDAFLAEQKGVMDAVQRLRAKAQAEGNLKSSAQQTVTVEPAPAAPVQATPAPQQAAAPPPAQTIVIQPANPQVVYVPTYNPTVVYGAWPYPAYPPYYYYPPGYAMATAATAAISFGVGMAVGASLWGNCNWGRGDVNVNINQYNNFTKNVNTANIAANRTQIQNSRASGGAANWQHDPDHRKGVQYRDPGTQQRFNKTGPANASSREAFRGRAQDGRQELSRGAAGEFKGGAAGGRQGGTGGATRAQGTSGPGGGRPAGSGGSGGAQGGAALSQRAGGGGGGGAREASAFQGVGQGRSVQADSARGQSSLGAARSSGNVRSAGGGFQGGGAARAGGGGSHGGGGRRR